MSHYHAYRPTLIPDYLQCRCGDIERPSLVLGIDAKASAAARDEAMSRVYAAPEWEARAEAIARKLAASGRTFRADDLWNAGLEKPREPRALGPILMRLMEEGLIVKVGTVNTAQVSGHRHPIALWRGVQSALIGEGNG